MIINPGRNKSPYNLKRQPCKHASVCTHAIIKQQKEERSWKYLGDCNDKIPQNKCHIPDMDRVSLLIVGCLLGCLGL